MDDRKDPSTGKNINILHGFTPEGVPLSSLSPEYNTGIYEFLRNVDPVECNPKLIFKFCCNYRKNDKDITAIDTTIHNPDVVS